MFIKNKSFKMDSQTIQKKRIRISRGLTSMDCSPCGKYIVCSFFNKWIKKFDLVSQRLILKSYSYHNDWINQIRYSTDGQLIASCSNDKSIVIRDASTFSKIGKTLLGHEGRVESVAFSPDSQHLASAGPDAIRIWDCQSQEQVGPIITETYSEFVQYSPNGLQILSAGLGGINIWDSTTREQIMTLCHHCLTAQYSLDGRNIVSNNCNVIKLWDATTGEQLGSDLKGHSSNIKSLAFLPDSSLIVSGSHDRTVRLWNSKTGKQVSILHNHAENVCTEQFSKDGKYVLSGSWDGTICIAKMKF